MKFKPKMSRSIWIMIIMMCSTTLVPIRNIMIGVELGFFDIFWFAFVLVILSWALWEFLITYYELGENKLVIKYGLKKQTVMIPYGSIRSVKSVTDILSRPKPDLTSRDSLEIKYSNGETFGGVVYISPKDKDGFVRELETRRQRGDCQDALEAEALNRF